MLIKVIFCLFIAGTILQTPVMAQEEKADSEVTVVSESKADSKVKADSQVKVDSDVKELSGISIIGNQEAPKSLYIVPWQNSEVGVATSLQSGLFDDSMRPLHKEVFLRELNFYELSHN